MPRLNLEPQVYPEGLFSEEVADGQWWVLHTRPRAEKSVARKLRERRQSIFSPVYEHLSRKGGRIRSSFLPVFPGYVFLLGDLEARHLALETNQVARVLTPPDQPQMWKDLRRINTLVTSGESLDPIDRLVPGAEVEITAGPFAGVEGKVVRVGKQLRLFVELRFLQRGVSVEVEKWMVRPISKATLTSV